MRKYVSTFTVHYFKSRKQPHSFDCSMYCKIIEFEVGCVVQRSKCVKRTVSWIGFTYNWLYAVEEIKHNIYFSAFNTISIERGLSSLGKHKHVIAVQIIVLNCKHCGCRSSICALLKKPWIVGMRVFLALFVAILYFVSGISAKSTPLQCHQGTFSLKKTGTQVTTCTSSSAKSCQIVFNKSAQTVVQSCSTSYCSFIDNVALVDKKNYRFAKL